MNFQHFVDAQNPVMSTVLDELRAGQKRTHWIRSLPVSGIR
ncbi:MAG: DUF1810 family protein [Betaproteobacteria bacterium]|nr:DUF1810 family protein [Betaproteobacteria bacterium]